LLCQNCNNFVLDNKIVTLIQILGKLIAVYYFQFRKVYTAAGQKNLRDSFAQSGKTLWIYNAQPNLASR